MAENRFDDFYFTIVKETGGLEGLLHSLFSFLIRRTDFFYECDPGDKMGFPPGAAAQMLMSTFDMYQKEHHKRFPKKDTVQYAEKLKKYQEKQKELKEKENQAKINNVSPLPTNTNVTTTQSQAESTNNTTTIATEKIPVEEKKKRRCASANSADKKRLTKNLHLLVRIMEPPQANIIGPRVYQMLQFRFQFQLALKEKISMLHSIPLQ